jgi:phosphoenolpyruvate carboxykinase (GTP)
MAMLPFCGYNMADYFGHWLKVAERDGAKLPKVFLVNWFRKDDEGNFVWPGFGDNIRVLEWIFRRTEGEGEAVDTPIGGVPAEGEIDIQGANVNPDDMRLLLEVDPEAVKAQLPQVEEHLARFGDGLPDALRSQLEALKQRMGERS